MFDQNIESKLSQRHAVELMFIECFYFLCCMASGPVSTF